MQTNRKKLYFGGVLLLLVAYGVSEFIKPRPEKPKERSVPDGVDQKLVGELTSPFKIAMTLRVGNEKVEIPIYVVGDRAVELDPEDPEKAAAIHNLKFMEWYEVAQKKTIPLSACRHWMATSLKRSDASIANEKNPKLKAFVESLAYPNFKKEQKGNQLLLSNAVMEYKISTSEGYTETQLSRFFAYDKLNAYRKAMLVKTPPFASLAVDEELKTRGLFPDRMELKLETPNGLVEFDATTQLVDLTADEEKRVREMIKVAEPKPK